MSPKKVDFGKIKTSKIAGIADSELIRAIAELNKKGEYPTTQEVFNIHRGQPLEAVATSKMWDSFLMGELTTLRNNDVLESAKLDNTLIWRVKKV
jgi:hypothetical protein